MARCAFCPSTATQTGEHLWSDWINAILPARTFTFSKREKGNVKSWQASELNLKARVVCGPCNHGWMSDIDNNEAKPILRHLIVDLGPRRISIYRLISIALFAFKTAVVADHMGTGGTPIFTEAERYAFRETLKLPSGLFMWIGALGSYNRGTFKSRHLVPEARGENDLGLYVFTYAAGHFVVQLAVARWSTHNPKRPLSPIMEQSAEWDSRMTPFFPPITGRIVWPPPEFLTYQTLDELTERWTTFTLSSGGRSPLQNDPKTPSLTESAAG
jgi:hypothetical protein